MYHKVVRSSCPKICTITRVTSNSLSLSLCYRVFLVIIDTEQEGVGVTLTEKWGWGFPFSCCEPTEDETFVSLNDSQRPSLFIALTMEILVRPPINCGIINPLESSIRKLISNEFDDHLSMVRGPKGLRISKKYLWVIFQISDRQDLQRYR